ncbi:helix-turn-helix domain-containing protein [Dyadobacter sediminis]|uniref:Helix-turn-helix domain-containing protein n=1 Tax=Dyadobacter sediminis TaxID=1493691 RepID=A0A5R9KC48_9BACT|nr:helix-turn-helix domain-containing protein [Dyadobacter sediminis]TLU92396.1 helix-turn-helix domain-containing protein [Dyadobacter sediminis]GGB94784.1 AraC family transcriptional regulator [Dyadobacter sediminis]
MEQFEMITRGDRSMPELLISPTQFRFSVIGDNQCTLASYNRRDYYKISLVLKGRSRLLYAHRGIDIPAPALVFTNPLIPYSWESGDESPAGFFCIFSDTFLHTGGRMENLQESPLFKVGGEPIYLLNQHQTDYLQSIFERMKLEADGEYVFKNDIIRNQLSLIIHEAIKMQPAMAYFVPANASERIAQLFLNLLEKQFPVDSSDKMLPLKRAGDYAAQLSVHVNHLNAAVQEVTGKSTTMHINERLLAEAKSLLIYTEWSVGDIAFSLGFEYASYFNNFFKKHSGITPLAFRKSL